MSATNPASALAALRKRAMLICVQCGAPFEALARARFCSDPCRWKFNNERRATPRQG